MKAPKQRNFVARSLSMSQYRQRIKKNLKAYENKRKCRGGVNTRPSHFITLRYVSDTPPDFILSR